MAIIAVDAMGGDHGPEVTVRATLDFLASQARAQAILVGRPEAIEAEVARLPEYQGLQGRWSIHPASEVVAMDESPQSALKNKKQSSQRLAIDLVKTGVADATVSAGNTGALMATARFVLKMLSGIERPAICAVMPTQKGKVYMLDLGANVDCKAHYLLQFAIMGSVLASVLEPGVTPKVGLLNIGEEEIKGNDVVKEAAELLKVAHLHFIGNIEGDGIFRGDADVVVCDGFVGNAVLKSSEGLAAMLSQFIREEFSRHFLTKLAALVALPVLNRFKRRVDHRRYNGAVLLGLKGIVVKSHGSADVCAFKAALDRAHAAAEQQLLTRISDHLASLRLTNVGVTDPVVVNDGVMGG